MTDDRLKIINATTDLQTPGIRKDVNVDMISVMKQMILKDLYLDKDIFEVLHNVDLEKKHALPEDYYNVNIFSYLRIPGAQSVVKNFICFEVNDVNELFQDTVFLERNVIFRTLSHEQDVQTKWGIDRQDLLAMLIKDRFSWTNHMGMRLNRIYDVGKSAENGYYYREIRFNVVSPNALVQQGTYIQQLDRQRGKYAY